MSQFTSLDIQPRAPRFSTQYLIHDHHYSNCLLKYLQSPLSAIDYHPSMLMISFLWFYQFIQLLSLPTCNFAIYSKEDIGVFEEVTVILQIANETTITQISLNC